MINVKVGAYYVRRDGEIKGPVSLRKKTSKLWPYQIGDDVYTPQGYRVASDTPTRLDLVKEAPAPLHGAV